MMEYNEIKKTVKAMSPGDKINRLCDIRTELFVFANDFAINGMGKLGVLLHRACNNILDVMQAT